MPLHYLCFMERRIKALYIVTIFAILAFLGMQVYWLYSRYEFSLAEYEEQIQNDLLTLLDEYNSQRRTAATEDKQDILQTSSFKLNMTANDTTGIDKTVSLKTITTHYKAQELLGLPQDHQLTADEKMAASKIIQEKILSGEVDSDTKVYEIKNPPTDEKIWIASKHLEIELRNPFTIKGLDSVLHKGGYNTKISLITSDTIAWTPILTRHHSLFNPEIELSVTYSEFENKMVVIRCIIPVSAVLMKMFDTLVVALTVSILLIICLAWQFSTILKQNRLDQMRNNFVTSMIHELKRPISTLKMCVSGIENEKMISEPTTKRELIAESREALNNLSAYFSKLRDITFNNATQIPLNTSCFSLNQLVSEVTGRISIPNGKQVKISDMSPTDVQLIADRVHILNILNNLFENSLKYSGQNVEVTVIYVPSANGVEIRVSDNGIGITATDRQKIFDRFYRGNNASDTGLPGMGLGLAYVKLLTDAHGGTISVESQIGVGTTFIITLPQ